MIQKAARDFARNECLPEVIDRDEHQRFPKEQVMKLAELGFMGMMVDPRYGGAGMDTVSYVLAMEEVSKVDASVSVCMSVNNSLVNWGLEEFGTEDQKRKYLTPLAQGRKTAASIRWRGFLSSGGRMRPLTFQRLLLQCSILAVILFAVVVVALKLGAVPVSLYGLGRHLGQLLLGEVHAARLRQGRDLLGVPVQIELRLPQRFDLA